MDWINSATTANMLNFTTDANIDCTSLTSYTPDPLIDWLPNSCLYTKYVPTWHLVKSYPKHKCEEAWFDESQNIYDWFCKYCGKEMF